MGVGRLSGNNDFEVSLSKKKVKSTITVQGGCDLHHGANDVILTDYVRY